METSVRDPAAEVKTDSASRPDLASHERCGDPGKRPVIGGGGCKRGESTRSATETMHEVPK